MIAAILIRSTFRARPAVRKTVELLKLKKNCAVYIEEKTGTKEMLKKVENYATYGTTKEKIEVNKPPKKGYGSIKQNYKKGGALGDRGEKIVELLKRMKW